MICIMCVVMWKSEKNDMYYMCSVYKLCVKELVLPSSFFIFYFYYFKSPTFILF